MFLGLRPLLSSIGQSHVAARSVIALLLTSSARSKLFMQSLAVSGKSLLSWVSAKPWSIAINWDADLLEKQQRGISLLLGVARPRTCREEARRRLERYIA